MTERLVAHRGALLVIDIQEKLIGKIEGRASVVANTVRLIKGGQALNLPIFATEQYPKGLGPSIPEIAELLPERAPKTAFHCCAAPAVMEGLYGRSIRHVTLAGIEAHVCVAQTALELMKLGFVVQVVADAVGSRSKMDWEFALRRLERAGAIVSTTEAVLFEWMESSECPGFKAISEMIKAHSSPS